MSDQSNAWGPGAGQGPMPPPDATTQMPLGGGDGPPPGPPLPPPSGGGFGPPSGPPMPPPSGGGFGPPPGGPVPPPKKKMSPLLLLLIPVGACLFLAVVGGIIGAVAGPAEEEPTATERSTTTEAPAEAEAEPVAEEADGPGEGDFAKCKDGEYSDNADLSAICSSHDGVDEWLAEYGECEDGSVIALRGEPECPNSGDLAKLLPGYVPEAGPDDVALCNDSTFSDNRELHNTCSSHGGVERWLAEYGRCSGGEVIRLADDPSCPGAEDLAELMPPDYVPPTTTTPPPTTAAPAPPEAAAPPPPPDPFAGESVSQQNARDKAADYLSFSAFSRTGLIGQLEFEGFSTEDATYGVDAQGADWNAQAALKAADYLEFSSFSRQGLIDQLIFEGFSPAEAEYGVSTTGL